MSMTPRERILAVYDGEEPDKTPVCVYEALLPQHPGDWCQRLQERGLGIIRSGRFFRPGWSSFGGDPRLPGVRYTRTEYVEKGVRKYRQTWETPAGSITGVMMTNPTAVAILLPTPEEYVVKQPSDWRVVSYLIKAILDNLAPTYESFERAEADLGDGGITVVSVGSTAWQRAWIELAGPERAVVDFHEQPDEVQEYIELSTRLHLRLAEFAAGYPGRFVNVGENMSDMTSPRYFREYCLPIYEIYGKQLAGTGKILGAHMDGRLGSLRKEIAETPLDVLESFSVPPTGDVTLSEVKSIWPGKMIFMNTASHLAWARPEEVRTFYEALAAEWGSRKGLLLELSEELPPETVGTHMSAAMDAFGY